MEVNFKTEALLDLDYWKKYGSKSEQNKITSLLQNMRETPFYGTGKPEALKYDLYGPVELTEKTESFIRLKTM